MDGERPPPQGIASGGYSLLARGPIPDRRCPRTLKRDREDSALQSLWWDSTEPRDWLDSAEYTLIADAIEPNDANENALPMDNREPTLPIDNTEPTLPMDSTEPLDRIDKIDRRPVDTMPAIIPVSVRASLPVWVVGRPCSGGRTVLGCSDCARVFGPCSVFGLCSVFGPCSASASRIERAAPPPLVRSSPDPGPRPPGASRWRALG